MSTGSSPWGRIDPDGTAYVTSATGERVIGSWQAGDTTAGLAYYIRRYDDLVTEVALLEHRLGSGAGDPASTRTQALALQQQIPTAAAIGDLDSLLTRVDALLVTAKEKADIVTAARHAARADAAAAKLALAEEAERIAERATSWKASGDRLRTIVDEWKLIKGVDRKTDDALWKRFSSARDEFGRRRGAHFAALDTERTTARAAKEKLVSRAQELSESSDWKDTAAAMKDLMAEWKVAPRASKEVEDGLWSRFRAAQDAFFARRSGVLAERDSEQLTNQKEKEALIAQANALDLTDVKAAQTALRDIQTRFDAIGHIPRDSVRRIDDQMRAAEQRVREAADVGWRRPSVETNPFLASMLERLTEAEQKLERAVKSGDAGRIAKAQADVEQRRNLLPAEAAANRPRNAEPADPGPSATGSDRKQNTSGWVRGDG
jgi:hypothetical protein